MDQPNNYVPEPGAKQWPGDLPPADRVRQGVIGHGVRYVLIVGLLGVIAAFFIVGIMH